MRIIHLVIVFLLIVLVYLFFRPRILEEYGRGGGRRGHGYGRGRGRGGYGNRSWYGGGVGYYNNPWYYSWYYPDFSYPSYSYSYPYYY